MKAKAMSGYNVEPVKGSYKSAVGDAAHWNADKQELLYVDMVGNAVLRYIPKTGETKQCELRDHISAAIPVEGYSDKYVITTERDVKVMEWDGRSTYPTSLKHLYTVDEDCRSNKFNDGKCDAVGRLWAGTMGYGPSLAEVNKKQGSLYSFDLEGKVRKHIDKLDISNGLAWTSDNCTFYHIDTLACRMDAFDFDLQEGTLSNKRPVFNFPKVNGIGVPVPDKMTIDVNGNLWVAMFAGQKILHIDPKIGKQIDSIEFPTKNVTSVAFGGPNLDILYATSTTLFLSREQAATQPNAGNLFQVTNLGTKGIAPFNYKGPI